ncbi:MAG: PspC domain-containing protein [Solirubrobacterales bacterium]|nr:PspC domain-containing protein [Solirubrobacterales bacterium]
MSAELEPGASPGRRLVRDTRNGIAGGVLAGIANRVGIDPVLLRIAFVAVTIATAGLGLLGYLAAWVLIPAGPASGVPGAEPGRRSWLARRRDRRGNWRVAAGVGFLTLSGLLILRELGVWWSDALVWPLILATSGAVLLWRQSRAMQPGPAELEPTRVAGEVTTAATSPTAATSSLPTTSPTAAASPSTPAATEAAGRRAGLADLYRGGFGIALVLGAALLFLYANGALGRARDVILALVVAALALGLILAPFLWRLGRNLTAERAERIRSQERAELAAHLHDSVLQTLTLVQRRAGDPREVAQLARRQERELRQWLFAAERKSASASLAAALEEAANEVEDAHRATIDAVVVGDRGVDERARALVAAAGEALVNAAKFASREGSIALYGELSAERAQVFIRDRGDGFDPAAIPGDRRGIRESIVARMGRHGGRAEVSSGPGGTEVELVMEWQRP